MAVKIEDLGAEPEEQTNVLTELTVLRSLALQHDHLVKFRGAGKLLKSPAEAKVIISTYC